MSASCFIIIYYYQMHPITLTAVEPIMVPLTLNGQELQMEVDTGAALSIISDATRQSLYPREKLHPTQVILKTYTDDPLEVKGKLHMNVQYGDQREKLALVVVGGNGPSLLGCNWLKYIRLNWRKFLQSEWHVRKPCNHFSSRINSYSPRTLVPSLLIQSLSMFHLMPHPSSSNLALYHLPLRMLSAGSCCKKQGIISPVAHSKWSAPIVPVPKKDGKFCICGDYEVTINQALDVEEFCVD